MGIKHSQILIFNGTFDHPITVNITFCNTCMLVCFQTNNFLWLKMMSYIRHEQRWGQLHSKVIKLQLLAKILQLNLHYKDFQM